MTERTGSIGSGEDNFFYDDVIDGMFKSSAASLGDILIFGATTLGNPGALSTIGGVSTPGLTTNAIPKNSAADAFTLVDSTISDTGSLVTITNDANITGDLDVDTDLNVDGDSVMVGDLAVDTNTLAVDSVAHQVTMGERFGIANVLSVTSTGTGNIFRLVRRESVVGRNVGVLFQLNNANSDDITYVRIVGGITTSGTGTEDGFLRFDVTDNGTDNSEKMRILGASGNVGIGETNALARLDVQTGGQASLSTLAGSIVLRATGSAGDGNYGAGIIFSKANGGILASDGPSIVAVQTSGASDSMGLAFNVHSPIGGNPRTEALCLDHVGAATFNFALKVLGVTTLGDQATNYVEVGITGDLTFVGGAGLIFGSMYNHDTSTTVTMGAAGTAVRIPSGFTVGQTHNVTFQNAREFLVTVAGMYKIDWSISFTMASGASQEIEGAVMLNNALNVQATAHRLIGTGTDTGAMSGVCILDLAANDVIALGVINESSTNDVVIEHANCTIVQIGGT